MYNYYDQSLLDRYASTLESVFGSRPCAQFGNWLPGRRMAVLTAGAGAARDCGSPWRGQRVPAATDDWPFPYLSGHTIPAFYLRVLAFVLAGSLALVWLAGGAPTRMRRYVDLFCMGAAFSLLETKNIVQFALLFGTTWFVNSLVFTGVLLSIYLQPPPGVTEPRQGIVHGIPPKRQLENFPDQFDQPSEDDDAKLMDLASYDVLVAFDPIERIIEEGRANGEVREGVDARLATYAVLGVAEMVLTGYVIGSLPRSHPEAYARDEEQLLALLIDGMSAPAA